MPMLHDYYCKKCDAEAYDKWTDDVPSCCDQPMNVLLHRLNDFEWGGPRQIPNLREEPFASRSELTRWTKERKLSLAESSEKVGGARNDMYDNTGKIFSYRGAPRRGNELYTNGVRRNG